MPRESIAVLLARVRNALSMSQTEFGNLVTTERKAVSRWEAGRSSPAGGSITVLAAAVHPIDPALAVALVEAHNETMSVRERPQYGAKLPAPAAPSPAPAASGPRPLPVVDGIVCAAADALDLSPKAVRPALLAAFEEAHARGFDVASVAAALRAGAAKGSAPT